MNIWLYIHMNFDLSAKMTELAAQRFRLLGEPMRLRILQVLEAGERPVYEIVTELGATQPNVSKHLQALCQGGLIRRRRAGLNIYYGITDPVVFKLCQLVCRSAEQHTRSELAQLGARSPRRGRSNAGARR
jgi:DNA-binding transcriptional ArsR family regulator